jgi:hypothetical protein
MSKLKLHIRLGNGSSVQATGREAETLLALMHAGQRGVTPLDAHRAGPAFRLAAYVHDLKRLGIPIEMDREPHPGGWHGRYRLVGDVAILRRSDVAESEAA